MAIGVYSIGGLALGYNIAFGGYASGHIAMGDRATGYYAWSNISEITSMEREEIREIISRENPNTWRWILNMFRRLV